MCTNCTPLVAGLFLFYYLFLKINQYDVIEAFKSTSRHLDDLLNTDNPYFDQMVIGRIYSKDFQLNKANFN